MSGLTNTTGFSFLGLTNLTQGNYDNLFVNNLTANTGTITVLNSTTGTITTLSSTTANITTLLTDLWRGTTTSSSMVIGVSGDTGTLTSYRNLIMSANKTLTLSGTGKITTPDILVSNLTASKMVLTDASKNLVSSSYTDSDFARLAASNTFTGTTNTFLGDIQIGRFSPVMDKSLYFKFHLPLDPTDGVYLSLYQTTGSTYICDTISSGDIHIGNSASPITQTGSIFLYGNTSISSGKNLLCNTLTGTTTGSAISLFGTSTSLIDLGNSVSTSVIRLNQNTSLAVGKILRTPYLYPTSTVADLYVGNQATDSGILYIELNTDLHSSRKLKLNNTTASKLLLTNASKEIISSAYDETTLPVSTPTQTALNLKANINAPVFTTSIGLTSGDITISSGNLLCNTYRGTTVGSAISLFSTTTAGITLGGASSGIILADNTSLASAKNLSISASGKIISNTIEGVSVSTTGSVFTNLTDGDLNVGTGLTTGDVFLHNSTYTAGGNIYCNRDTYIDASRKLVCDNLSGTSASIDLSLAGNLTTANVNIGTSLTSGNVNLGLIGMTGKISCNANVEIGTSANNKGLSCNYFQSFNVGDLMRYSATSTTGNIRLGENQTSGNITLGHTTPASDSGTLIINKTTTLAANKNLTLGSQSKLVGGSNGSVNITAVAYTNVAVITTASVAGFYQVFIYGSSATQTYSVCCFMSADNSGAVQTTASRNMTFQASGANWCITATVVPTSTISMGYNIVRLF